MTCGGGTGGAVRASRLHGGHKGGGSAMSDCEHISYEKIYEK
jgi:hypothetical protein